MDILNTGRAKSSVHDRLLSFWLGRLQADQEFWLAKWHKHLNYREFLPDCCFENNTFSRNYYINPLDSTEKILCLPHKHPVSNTAAAGERWEAGARDIITANLEHLQEDHLLLTFEGFKAVCTNKHENLPRRAT